MPGDRGVPTPVVSAIGHEPDNPLCDLVADLRAATPTDAAKRVVPDAAAEQRLVADLRRRSAQALRNWVPREQRALAQLRSRPVLAQPLAALTARAEEIHRARAAVRRDITRLIDRRDRTGRAPVARGWPHWVRRPRWRAATPSCRSSRDSMAVLRSVDDAPAGTRLRMRVADGAVTAVSEGCR